MIAEQRLAKALSLKFRVPITAQYHGSNDFRTTFDAGSKYPEVVIDVPTQLIAGIGRKKGAVDALVEMIWRRWTDVKAEIFYDAPTNRIGIRTPYNPEFITELRAFISPGARTWDGSTKTWYANASYLDSIERLVKKYFPDATVTGPAAFEAPESDGDCYSRLLKPLPDSALKSVYRAITMACHPDKATTPDERVKFTEIMTQVNTVWTEIKKARGWA